VTRDFVCSAKASNGSSRAPELGEARFAYFKLQREFISAPASSLEISKKIKPTRKHQSWPLAFDWYIFGRVNWGWKTARRQDTTLETVASWPREAIREHRVLKWG
jgi:hypothetical protein